MMPSHADSSVSAPAPVPRQDPLTARSVVFGFLLALLMVSINSYLTLKVGIIEEGTIITMMLFVAAMRAIGQRVTSQEAALVATMGSAGGSFSFIVNFFAASQMVGAPLTWTQMLLLPVVTSLVGLFMAVPLRRLYVVEEPLPWPTSKATITAINAMTTEEGARQARLLLICSAVAGLYVFLSGGLHIVPEDVTFALPLLGGIPVSLALSPFILSAGYLIGLRVGIGFLCGGLILLAMTPYVPNHVPHKYFWPGVMFLVTSGLTTLALNGKTVMRALGSLSNLRGFGEEDADQVMSMRSYKWLFALTALFALGTLWLFFGVSLLVAFVMLTVGGVVLNFIAARAAGETAFNPVRTMGIMLQGIAAGFGANTPGALLTGAGVAAGSIDQAGLLTQDNVFGRHFGLSARRQWFAQLAVLLPIAVLAMFVFRQIAIAYPLSMDGGALPSPVAKSWAAMALVFSGQGALPPFAVEAMCIGGFGGIIFALIDAAAARRLKREDGSTSLARFVPHSMGFGIGLIIPVSYDMAFFVGAIVLCVILPKMFKMKDDTLNSIAAAGILGEGLVGLINALLISFGVLAKG